MPPSGPEIVNRHSRRIAAPAQALGVELDRLGGPADRWWPSPAWWPLRLDGRDGELLVTGAAGGHGPIRYAVEEYQPGRRVRFRFAPGLGLEGFHELVVEPEDGAPHGTTGSGTTGSGVCRVTHLLQARPVTPRMRLLWPLLVRPLHDALVEDLLDRAELLGTGRVERPARWSRGVRLRHALLWPSPRPVAVPEAARELRAGFDRTDLADAYRFPLRPGLPRRPQDWAGALAGGAPRWVRALMAARNLAVPVLGIERTGRQVLRPLPAGTPDEALLRTDARHFDARVGVTVDDDAVVVSTLARARDPRGRVYLGVVRRVHPLVVRGMIRHLTRAQALAARSAALEPGSAPGRPA